MENLSTLDETALNVELSRAFKQLHALNVSITTERQRGNLAGVQAMLPLYQHWLDRYRAVSAQLGKVEGLSALERFYLDAGEYVRDAANALPDAIAKVPQAVGIGLLKGLWPFALAAVAYLWWRGKL